MARKARQTKFDDGKQRFECRFDQDVYDGIKKLADETGVSMNQMLQGLARAAMRYAHPGKEIEIDHETGPGFERDQEGAVWLGRGGYHRAAIQHEPGDTPDPDDFEYVPIELFYQLDFTERRVVRDDSQPVE